MIYPSGFVEILGSGIASGYVFHPYHYMELFYNISGIEETLGLGVLNGWPTVHARLTGIEGVLSQAGVDGTTLVITNGYSNGMGEPVFYQKNNETLEFKSLVAGTGVMLSSDTGEITISVTGIQNTLSGQAPVSVDQGLGIISMLPATNRQDGYLTSADWSYFQAKLDPGTTTTDIPEGANLYYTDQRVTDYINASGVTGPAGPSGAQGPIGPTGVQGPQGLPGSGVSSALTPLYLNSGVLSSVITMTGIDFGSTPVASKSFIISDSRISESNIITVSTSAIAPSGRTSDDWQWDMISFSAVAGTNQFTLYASVDNLQNVIGTRNILYTIY